MTIEIHQPRLAALIQLRMATGRFQSVEEALLEALESSMAPPSPPRPRESLEELFASVRGLADDVAFSRDPSPGRPVDLS